MSIAAAVLWSVGTTFAFLWVWSLTVSLRPGAKDDIVSIFGCQALAYLLALFLILRAYAPFSPIRDFLGIRRTHVAFYPVAVLLGLALQFPANASYEGICRAVQSRYPCSRSVDDRLVDVFTDATSGKRALLVAVIVLLGPLLEEMFFRGALFRPLRRRYRPGSAIVASAALFAIAHAEWQMFLPIALVGIALGMIRAFSGSIVPAVVLHTTFNAIPIYAALTGQASQGGGEMPPTSLIAGGSVATLLLLGIVQFIGRRARSAIAVREKDRR